LFRGLFKVGLGMFRVYYIVFNGVYSSLRSNKAGKSKEANSGEAEKQRSTKAEKQGKEERQRSKQQRSRTVEKQRSKEA
jgi:Flp pilus assembly protein TadB